MQQVDQWFRAGSRWLNPAWPLSPGSASITRMVWSSDLIAWRHTPERSETR
jgi:hypothetical protein